MLADVLPDAPTTTDDALQRYDALPAVEPEFMIGTWHGAEVPTAHPLDGMLAASGWWGKQFRDAETVHPLLFPTSDGSALWPLNPALAFAGLGVATKVPRSIHTFQRHPSFSKGLPHRDCCGSIA